MLTVNREGQKQLLLFTSSAARFDLKASESFIHPSVSAHPAVPPSIYLFISHTQQWTKYSEDLFKHVLHVYWVTPYNPIPKQPEHLNLPLVVGCSIDLNVPGNTCANYPEKVSEFQVVLLTLIYVRFQLSYIAKPTWRENTEGNRISFRFLTTFHVIQNPSSVLEPRRSPKSASGGVSVNVFLRAHLVSNVVLFRLLSLRLRCNQSPEALPCFSSYKTDLLVNQNCSHIHCESLRKPIKTYDAGRRSGGLGPSSGGNLVLVSALQLQVFGFPLILNHQATDFFECFPH